MKIKKVKKHITNIEQLEVGMIISCNISKDKLKYKKIVIEKIEQPYWTKNPIFITVIDQNGNQFKWKDIFV